MRLELSPSLLPHLSAQGRVWRDGFGKNPDHVEHDGSVVLC